MTTNDDRDDEATRDTGDAIRGGNASAAEPPAPTTAHLAQQILANHRISLGTRHPSGVVDNATPDKQIAATARGQRAARSGYGNAPGGSVALDRRMLAGMLQLAQTFNFHVTEIAGGSHSRTSRHYAGIAFDVARINGMPVNASNPRWRAFVAAGRELGATETLGPGDPGHSTHVHLAWPRVAPAAAPPGGALAAEGALNVQRVDDVEEAETCCEGGDGSDGEGQIVERLRAALTECEGERAGLSVLGRELRQEEQARLDAVTAAAYHLRAALEALSAAPWPG